MRESGDASRGVQIDVVEARVLREEDLVRERLQVDESEKHDGVEGVRGLAGVPVLPKLFWHQLKLEKTWIY